ncbi:MAG: polysaccharide biosynthesis/export family protein [Chitinophagaceae bacterium]
MNRFLFIGLLLAAIALSSSCVTSKELRYLQTDFDTNTLRQISFKSTIIQKNDLLSIVVFSDNPVASAPYNQGSVSGTSAGVGGEITTYSASSTGGGYLVDHEGKIQFPLVGPLHVEGLTKDQLVQLLNEKLKDFLKNPYYTIRFLNIKVTLLGEVNRPGMFTAPTERLNILEAIGLAGDLTFFGLRHNVLVIRESNGQRQFGYLDLRKGNIFKSPYYNLQQNDIVVVDMNKRKINANDQVVSRNIGLAASVLSTIAILLSLLKIN